MDAHGRHGRCGDAAVTQIFSLAVTDNLGLASVADTVTITVEPPVDTTRPSVALSGGPSEIDGPTEFVVQAAFSENVTGFTTLDVVVEHATVKSLSGSGATYQLAISADASGDVTISVPANVANDAVLNGNTASNDLVVSNQIVPLQQDAIKRSTVSNQSNFVVNQPKLMGFLRGGSRSGGFDAQATRGRGNFTLFQNPDESSTGWFRIVSSWSEIDGVDTHYVLGSFGAHATVRPNLMVGGLFQYDNSDQLTSLGKLKGESALVGPYFVAKLDEHDLFFEGRLLYGSTNYEWDASNSVDGRFNGNRLLAMFAVEGVMDYGTYSILPNAAVSHVVDTLDSYTDGFGNSVPSQNVSQTAVKIGLDITWPVSVASGGLDLNTGFSGSYQKQESSIDPASDTERYLGGAHIGFNRQFESGSRLDARLFYEGLGEADYQQLGAEVSYSFKF